MAALTLFARFPIALWTCSLVPSNSGIVDTPLRTLPGHFGPVFFLVFSPDNKTLVTVSGDVNFWDFDSGRLIRKISDLGREAYAVDISADGSMFATGTKGSTDDNTPNPPLMEAKIWDYNQRTVLQTIGLDKHGLQEGVHAVAFSPDSTMLAVGGSDHATDPVKLFDVNTGNQLHEISDREGFVKHLVFNRAGTLLAICRQPNRVELWNLSILKKVQEFLGNRGEKIALSPNGKLLAYGRDDRSIQIMNVDTGELVIRMAGHDQDHPWGYGISFAFSPDGAILASGSGDTTIILWNVTDGRKLGTVAGHTEYVISLAFSPDGTKLVSGADEEQAKIWDVSVITGASGSTTSGRGSSANDATSRTASVKVLIACLLLGLPIMH